MSPALALSLLFLLPFAYAQNCKNPPASLANLANSYPPPYNIANILSGDDEANQVYSEMLADPDMQVFLKIAPKGSADGTGNFAKVTYNGASDPDCWWTYTTCKEPKHAGLEPDIFTCQEPSTWGLTFDDGPYCGQGPLLTFLEQQNQQATFFLIGGNVMQFPVEAQDILTNGHEVCAHTWSHHYTTSLTNAQVFAELYYTKKVIKEVTGVTTRCWRAPYGDVDDRVRAIAAYLDSRTVLWDNDTDDWSIDDGTPAATIQANFAKIISSVPGTGTGTIVLDHSISDKLIAMFISQYPKISAAFKNIQPALTCNNWTTPYYETNISYPNFAQYVKGTRASNYNASVSLNLSGGKLLLGNITDEAATPVNAAVSASSNATVPSSTSGAPAATSSTAAAKTGAATKVVGGGSLAAVFLMALAVAALS